MTRHALLLVLTLAAVAEAADELGPPELPSGPLPAPFPWAAVVLGTLGCIAVAVTVVVRRRSPEPEEPTVPVAPRGPPPEEVALAELDALRARRCESLEDVNAFHDDLAAAMRAFVSGAHDVPGLQTTTEEFAAGLRAHVPDTVVTPLVAILRRCDMARFARSGSSSEARSALVNDAAVLVRAATGQAS